MINIISGYQGLDNLLTLSPSIMAIVDDFRGASSAETEARARIDRATLLVEEDVAEVHRGRMSLPLPRRRCSWCAAVWPTGSSASTCAGRRVVCHPARCHPTRCQPAARCHQAASHEPVAARLPRLIARPASDPRILPGTNVQAGKTRIASRDPRYPSLLPGEAHE